MITEKLISQFHWHLVLWLGLPIGIIIFIISGFGIYGAAVVPDSGVGNTWQRVDTIQVAYSHIVSHTCGPRLSWPPTISGAWKPQSRDGVDARRVEELINFLWGSDPRYGYRINFPVSSSLQNTRFISISHTVTIWFLRYLAKRLILTRYTNLKTRRMSVCESQAQR